MAKLKEKEAFLERTNTSSSSKLSLTCPGNVNYYKGAHHPITTLPVEIEKTFEIFKTN